MQMGWLSQVHAQLEPTREFVQHWRIVNRGNEDIERLHVEIASCIHDRHGDLRTARLFGLERNSNLSLVKRYVNNFGF